MKKLFAVLVLVLAVASIPAVADTTAVASCGEWCYQQCVCATPSGYPTEAERLACQAACEYTCGGGYFPI